LLYSLMFRR